MFSIRCGMNQTKLKPCTAYCNPVDAHRFLTMKYWVPGTQDYMKKSKISSHPKAKIGCLWHPGTLKHSPVDVNWSLKNSYYPSYLFLLVLGKGLQILLDQVMIIHMYEPQEILMNNTCLKKNTPPLRSNEVLMFSTMQKRKQKWILKLTSLFTSEQGTVL